MVSLRNLIDVPFGMPHMKELLSLWLSLRPEKSMPRMYEQLPVSIQQSLRVPLAFKQKIFSAEWTSVSLHHKIPLSRLLLRSVQNPNTSKKNKYVEIHRQMFLNALAVKTRKPIFVISIQRITSQVFQWNTPRVYNPHQSNN